MFIKEIYINIKSSVSYRVISFLRGIIIVDKIYIGLMNHWNNDHYTFSLSRLAKFQQLIELILSVLIWFD